jgi:hypothetical protein
VTTKAFLQRYVQQRAAAAAQVHGNIIDSVAEFAVD